MAFLAKIAAVILGFLILIWVGAAQLVGLNKPVKNLGPDDFGVTFSAKQAVSLGLNPKETYRAILDDLGVRRLRLAAYWSEIELERGKYDFSGLDFQIAEAAKRDAKVILAVGAKLPRWPECHIPQWLRDKLEIRNSKLEIPPQEKQLYEDALLLYVRKVVERYKDVAAVEAWQVENEPFFKFGTCPAIAPETLAKEVKLVKELDSRPILITDSGELGTWIGAARTGDIVGTTMYRRNLTPVGYVNFPLPARFYEKKAAMIRRILGKKVLVAEMQAEPWMPTPLLANFSLEEQFRGLDFGRFKDNLAYARASGLGPIYFWGAEWWYWLKTNDHPEFWDWAKETLWSR